VADRPAPDASSDPPRPDASGEVPGKQPEVQGIDPQKLLRIAGVTREVLEEARRIRPEPSAVEHLRRVHGQITQELQESLPPELYDELSDLTPEVRDGTLEELSLAHAEILGWLEGLFQGTQLALQFQAAHAAQQAMMDRARRGLPSPDTEAPAPGRYL
jgi:proteasome activator-like protein